MPALSSAGGRRDIGGPQPVGIELFEHSEECRATCAFAWSFWTDVRTWTLDADVERVELDGPFAAGARGVTHSKSSGRIEWRIVEAAGHRAVLEFPLRGALGRLTWTFEDAGTHTRITQRWELEGERAAELAEQFGPMLRAGAPEGMRKLARSIEQANVTE